MYFKRDVKRVILSLNILAMSFRDFLLKEVMLVHLEDYL